MYSNTLSAVILGSNITDWIDTNNRFRQGDTLSPTLFAIYINDLVTELNTLKLGIDINKNNICCLLYADDLVIFVETEHNLQFLLNALFMWCSKWKMKINKSKSKIIHYRRKGLGRSVCVLFQSWYLFIMI